jgi:ParB-like chromosome segregation protein Spo0J
VISLRAKLVKTTDCIPMPELERTFYDQSNFRYLRKVIDSEGFKSAYPVRAVFNGRRSVFEVFDGIHRTKIAQDLGIPRIPLIDETGILTRQQAIAEGIKANKTHASYNPIDIARHLKVLGESLSEARKRDDSFGRPERFSLILLAQETGMSEKSISQYLQLLRLPEDVQTMVGEGTLKFSYALVLLRLDKTPYKHMIPKLAQEVNREGLSRRELERKVETIRRKGYDDDTKACVGCKRAFPKEHLSYPCLCPSCVQKLRSEAKMEPNLNPKTDKRTEAMRNYLGLNALLSERWTQKGKEIPEKAKEYLEQLHEEWKNTPIEGTEDDIAVRETLEDMEEE